MSEATEFELTDREALNGLLRLEGAVLILDALKQVDASAPGFVLAKTIAEREIAELRIDYAQRVLRAAARHGVAIGDMKSVMTQPRNRKVIIVCEPFDATEQEG